MNVSWNLGFTHHNEKRDLNVNLQSIVEIIQQSSLLRMKSVVYCIIFSANKIWIIMQPPTLRTLCQSPSPSQKTITEPAAMPEPMPEPYITLELEPNMSDQMRELANCPSPREYWWNMRGWCGALTRQ